MKTAAGHAGSPIRVLLVEDVPGDARLIVEMLRETNGGGFELEREDRLEGAIERLRGANVDVVLLDLGLPDSEGIATYERAQREAPTEPIVVISGLDDEQLALEAVRSGAQDYLVKGRIDGPLLARVLRYAIQRNRSEQALRERNEQFRQLTETIREVYYLMDAAFEEVVYVSPAYESIWGRSPQSLYEDPRSFLDAVVPEDRATVLANVGRVQRTGERVEDEFRVLRPDGEIRWILARTGGVMDEAGRVHRIAGVALDITERKNAEEALWASELRLRNLFETLNLIVLVLDAEGRVDYVNPFLLELTGYTRDETIGRDWVETFLREGERPKMSAVFQELLAGHPHTHYRNPILTKAGEERMISWHNVVLRDSEGRPVGAMSVGEDVTAQDRLEAQLQQAQKMEAVGQLAGGVAHDFNNLLTSILGPAELLLDDLSADDPARTDLMDIKTAAERAAALTRQLLAFSRRQVLEPQVLDLNELIANLNRMLGRVIGEDIRLSTLPAPDLGAVLADPGQLEQVIVNLVVNSRDAMPGGGTLTIETANAELDADYVEDHPAVDAESYVMLAISDTGSGMPPEVRQRIFEPFFTTKPRGKGTGLGLATVYGIVQQSGGHVFVYSEIDQGTAFKIYLPRVDQAAESLAVDSHEAESLGGTETVLVVEDDEMVRNATRKLLEARGYQVLVADSGSEAVRIAREHAGPLPLLLTDVVLPEMSGPELAERVHAVRPSIRTIFVSGYTDDTIVHHGVLAPGVHFLQKPFTSSGLARKVRAVLDRTQPPPPPPAH